VSTALAVANGVLIYFGYIVLCIFLGQMLVTWARRKRR